MSEQPHLQLERYRLNEGQILMGFVSPESIGSTDQDQLKQSVERYAEYLETTEGKPFVAVDATVPAELAPFAATEDAEQQAFVVTEGKGNIEVVYGKKNAIRQPVEPGSMLLVGASTSEKKTPWMRADPTNETQLRGYWIGSAQTDSATRQESNLDLTAGAKMRRVNEKLFDKQRVKRARALGRIVINR